MIQIFKNKNFSWLFLANFTSQLGSVVGMTAFMLYLLRKFSSQPYYATITELMYTLPMIFVFFLVGVVADRLNRKKIAVNCDLVSACDFINYSTNNDYAGLDLPIIRDSLFKKWRFEIFSTRSIFFITGDINGRSICNISRFKPAS